MDEVERKKEPSLPPDYVSLAQLREQWLQTQEEKKLKQEGEERRERESRAQNEKNQNQRGQARMAGGFLRGTGMILDKGKRKEIINGGPVNGVENDKMSEVIRGGRTRYFKSHVGVEERAKDRCKGAEIVVGGDGIEEICSVSVVEVADVKRADLRGGFRGSCRNWDSRRANELEHSETGLDAEKKVENEIGHAQNLRWRRKEGKVDSELEKRTEEVSEVCREIGSLCVADGNGIGLRNSKIGIKAEERVCKGEGSNVDEVELKIGKVDHEVLAGESAKMGKSRSNFVQEWRQKRPEIAAEKDISERDGSNGNKVALEIEKNLDHEIFAGESEKIGENGGAVKGNREKRDGKKDFANGRRYIRTELSVKVDRVEGEGSNVNKVAPEIEKKVDHDVEAQESAKTGINRWFVKGYRKNEDQRRVLHPERRSTGPEISAEVDKIVGEVSNGNKMRLKIEEVVDHEVLYGESGKMGNNRGAVKGYHTNRMGRSDFGRGRGWGHTRFEMSDSRWKANSGENGMVWVKKEEKLEA